MRGFLCKWYPHKFGANIKLMNGLAGFARCGRCGTYRIWEKNR